MTTTTTMTTAAATSSPANNVNNINNNDYNNVIICGSSGNKDTTRKLGDCGNDSSMNFIRENDVDNDDVENWSPSRKRNQSA